MSLNVLYFLTDDHASWGLGCYGNSEVQSPVLDRLAEAGVRFENAFCPTPVCSPGRAAQTLGRTPSQTGLHDWLLQNDPKIANRNWIDDEVSLYDLLQKHGYTVGYSGKWHMGNPMDNPRGVDWYLSSGRTYGRAKKRIGRLSEDSEKEHVYVKNDELYSAPGRSATHYTDGVIEFLDRRPQDRPFFVTVGFTETHSPWRNRDPDCLKLYESATFRDIEAEPQHPWASNEGYRFEVPQSELHRQFYAGVTEIDRCVGRLLKALDERGLRENTLIVYTADHGLCLGQHGIYGKGNGTRPLNMYDPNLRIPLIWSGPGVTAKGSRVAEYVDQYDTFLSLCSVLGLDGDLDSARNYPGSDYSRVLSGRHLEGWDDTRFGEYGDLRMVRNREFKLIRRYPNGPDEFFVLNSIDGERRNQVANPFYAEVIAAMDERLQAFYAEHSDPEKSGLLGKELPVHNHCEAWRHGVRESRGLQGAG